MAIMTPQAFGANPQANVQEQPFGQDYIALEANATTLPAYLYMAQSPNAWGQLHNLLENGITQNAGIFGAYMSNRYANNPYYRGFFGKGTGGAMRPSVVVNTTNVQVKAPIFNRLVSNLTIKSITTAGAGAGLEVTGVIFDTAIGTTPPQKGMQLRGETTTGIMQDFYVSNITDIDQNTNTVTCKIAPILTTTTLGQFAAGSQVWQTGEIQGTTTREMTQVTTKPVTIFQQAQVGVKTFAYDWTSANTTQKVYWGIDVAMTDLTNPFISRGLGIQTSGKYQLTWTLGFLQHCVDFMVGRESALVWQKAADQAQGTYLGLYSDEDLLTTNGVVPTIEELGFNRTYNPALLTLQDFTLFQQAIRRADFSFVTDYAMLSGDDFDLLMQQTFQNVPTNTVDMQTANRGGDISQGFEDDRSIAWGIRNLKLSQGLHYYGQCYGQFTSTVNGTTGTSAEYSQNSMLMPINYQRDVTIGGQAQTCGTVVLLTQTAYNPAWSTVTSSLPNPSFGNSPFLMDMDVFGTAKSCAMIGIKDKAAYTATKDNISIIKGESNLGVYVNNPFACAMFKPV